MMPFSMNQLNQRVENALEKITNLKEEVDEILAKNPSLSSFSFCPAQFFKDLTEYDGKALLVFEENGPALLKMFELTSKAAKEERKRRFFQAKIDEKMEKVASKMRNEESKRRRLQKKINKLRLNLRGSPSSSQELM